MHVMLSVVHISFEIMFDVDDTFDMSANLLNTSSKFTYPQSHIKIYIIQEDRYYT